MDRISFEAYVDQVLVPVHWPGAVVVIMNNLAAHKTAANVQRLGQYGIEA